jgi:hypothetical protein
VPTAGPNPGEPALAGDFVVIESTPRRYAARVAITSDFDI